MRKVVLRVQQRYAQFMESVLVFYCTKCRTPAIHDIQWPRLQSRWYVCTFAPPIGFIPSPIPKQLNACKQPTDEVRKPLTRP